MVPREVAAVVPVVAVMIAIGVYPNVVLERINPTSEGVVRWVETVQTGQAGLPGGLRAQVQADYRPPSGIALAQGAPGEAEGAP
jgi:hypothetical protein